MYQQTHAEPQRRAQARAQHEPAPRRPCEQGGKAVRRSGQIRSEKEAGKGECGKETGKENESGETGKGEYGEHICTSTGFDACQCLTNAKPADDIQHRVSSVFPHRTILLASNAEIQLDSSEIC